jgi:hypothetical protein
MSDKPVTPQPKDKTKDKPHPARPVTKAERAAQKRADKMVIKRMRKR